MIRIEEHLHFQICEYIRYQYPNILFNTDLSGINLNIGQANKIKKLRSNRGFPDIIIYQPNQKYHGLFLEVKKESPFKLDGKLKRNKHLFEQAEIMKKLNKLGYKALFVFKFDMAKLIIDSYLNSKS